MTGDARRTAELAARESYGRLVAYLSARSRDVAAAEDALAEAFRTALETWPERGIPDKPEAWLLTVARRTMIHAGRRATLHGHAVETLRHLGEAEIDMPDMGERETFPDERLKLMFVCAHPAIDPAARTPLMLQTVLGLDAVRIASAFLVSPSTISQRLVRAKGKIRDAGIAFSVPAHDELPERLDAVLAAIYAAYGSGWDDATGADPKRKGLALEAIGLARVLAALLPREPEPAGLLALMLYCEARQTARRDKEGHFVPLSEHDVSLWNGGMIDEAELLLSRAAAMVRPGPFQTEAAIQSVHARRGITGETNFAALAMLYDALAAMTPTIGVLVGRAAALGDYAGAAAGLAALDELPEDALAEYQPAWALRAHLLAGLGHTEAARAAYARAMQLADDLAVWEFLRERMARLEG